MKDLQRAISGKRDHLKIRHDFAHGEQLGPDLAYFVGPKPKKTDPERVKEFETVVGTDDVIGPCMRRITNAIVGRDPEWSLQHGDLSVSFEPKEGKALTEEQTRVISSLEALEEAGGDWHLAVNLQAKLAQAHYISQWAGEAFVRLYLPEELSRLDPDFEPPGELSEDELEEVNPALTQGSLESVAAALERTYLEVYDPRHAGEVRSVNGVLRGLYFLYKRDDQDYVEYHTPAAIIHYKRNGDKLEEVSRYDSPYAEHNRGRYRGRKFMMIRLEREGGPALTDDLMQKQSRLNAVLTNGNRNDHFSGYRSVITTNADPVTKLNAKGEEEDVEWKLAPDIVTELVGLPLELDAEGNPTRYATPGVHVIEPVNPEYNLKWAANWEERCYATLDQRHIYLGMNAGLAVEAQLEMRGPFDERAVKESGPVALLLNTTVERALEFAQWLAKGDALEVRCVARMFVKVLRGNLEEFKAQIDAYSRGLASIETVVESNPSVTDVAGERKRVEKMQEDKRERERVEIEALALTSRAA